MDAEIIDVLVVFPDSHPVVRRIPDEPWSFKRLIGDDTWYMTLGNPPSLLRIICHHEIGDLNEHTYIYVSRTEVLRATHTDGNPSKMYRHKSLTTTDVNFCLDHWSLNTIHKKAHRPGTLNSVDEILESLNWSP